VPISKSSRRGVLQRNVWFITQRDSDPLTLRTNQKLFLRNLLTFTSAVSWYFLNAQWKLIFYRQCWQRRQALCWPLPHTRLRTTNVLFCCLSLTSQATAFATCSAFLQHRYESVNYVSCWIAHLWRRNASRYKDTSSIVASYTNFAHLASAATKRQPSTAAHLLWGNNLTNKLRIASVGAFVCVLFITCVKLCRDFLLISFFLAHVCACLCSSHVMSTPHPSGRRWTCCLIRTVWPCFF